MRTKTQTILAVMHVVTWITFIGLMIKAGAILTSYVVSVFNPAATKNLYINLNLSNLHAFDFLHYTATVSFMVAVLIMEAYIAFLVIKIFLKIKMSNPFTMEVSDIIERISYFLFATWVITVFQNAHTSWLHKKVESLQLSHVSNEFIFLAGVVFVISQVFKKGVELQSENELIV